MTHLILKKMDSSVYNWMRNWSYLVEKSQGKIEDFWVPSPYGMIKNPTIKQEESNGEITVSIKYDELREFKLRDIVTCESGYNHGERFKVVGIREGKLELEGDWSGGTHNVCQKGWIPTSECILVSRAENNKFF